MMPREHSRRKSVASDVRVHACYFAHDVHSGIVVVREYGLTCPPDFAFAYHASARRSSPSQTLESVLDWCQLSCEAGSSEGTFVSLGSFTASCASAAYVPKLGSLRSKRLSPLP